MNSLLIICGIIIYLLIGVGLSVLMYAIDKKNNNEDDVELYKIMTFTWPLLFTARILNYVFEFVSSIYDSLIKNIDNAFEQEGSSDILNENQL